MKIKPKIFKSKFSDLKVIVHSSGFINLIDDEGNQISLGVTPNARTDLIHKAMFYLQEQKEKEKDE